MITLLLFKNLTPKILYILKKWKSQPENLYCVLKKIEYNLVTVVSKLKLTWI